MSVRNSDPITSHESAEALGELAKKLRARILQLARAAGRAGITANEAERMIAEHKGHSITPRFIELIERGELVRVRVGIGKPTKRFPAGQPRYMTRFDGETKRNVLVHWAPEFAPVSETNKVSGQADLFEAA